MVNYKGLFERCCGVSEDILDDPRNLRNYSNKVNSDIRKSDKYELARVGYDVLSEDEKVGTEYAY